MSGDSNFVIYSFLYFWEVLRKLISHSRSSEIGGDEGMRGWLFRGGDPSVSVHKIKLS